MKKALITGVTGQDGHYLTKLLLDKGYEVHGLIRKASTFNTERIDEFYNNPDIGYKTLHLHYGDMTDSSNLNRLLDKVQPDEIYNLAAQSHVKVSFEMPEYTSDVDGIGVVRLLDAIKDTGINTKYYQACHSEDTFALTNKGFKKYDKIDVGDIVYTINIETGLLEEKPVNEIFIYEYDGEMIQIQNKRINQLVTPNHKLVVQDDNSKIKYIVAEDLLKELKYENTSNLSIPISKFNGDIIEDIEFSNYIDMSEMSSNCTKNILKSMPMKDYLYLLGIFIGDGHVKVDYNSKSSMTRKEYTTNRENNGRFKKLNNKDIKNKVRILTYIDLYIPENDKARNRLINTLIKNNIEFKSNKNIVSLSSFVLSRMFLQSGNNAHIKCIPKWVFQLSHQYLTNLYEGLIDSDGHWRKTLSGEFRASYTTVSEKLLEDFILLCYKIGKYCSFYKVSPQSNLFKAENRYIKSTATYTYYINIANIKTNKIYRDNIKIIPYKGKVWCLEVEDNHNFIIMRNNKIAFSGNSTSELFGGLAETAPQNENTPMTPRSPYACAKLYAYWITKNYREAYNIFACNGILFNHESIFRLPTFVTRKITQAVSRIYHGKQEILSLGNIDAIRDWSYASDMVEGMYLMLQQNKPDDYVLASGEGHTVREFIEKAFKHVEIDVIWHGKGIDEIGINPRTNRTLVKIEERFFRPTEVDVLIGDATKAKKILGWKPRVSFEQLIEMMMDYDLQLNRKD